MNSLLAYLRKHKAEGRIVIIDDISRFSREMEGHWALRRQLKAAGGILESPSIEFGEDADSILQENVRASFAQHHRQKNAEQTRNRMRGRLLNGYWPFQASLGYKYDRREGHQGKCLVRHDPLASIIQEGLEGFASGRFQAQAEVKRFFEAHPAFPRGHRGLVRNQLVHDILTKPLYAGYIEAPTWGIPLRKGNHDALISFETFDRIQRRLKEGAKTPARADINSDFPLRGTVACACCGKLMTACWSTSRTGDRHPYYMCFGKACPQRRKSIKRDIVEHAFAKLLDRLTPGPQLVRLAAEMFKNAWSQRVAQAEAIAKNCELEARKVESQIAALVDRVVEATSEVVISAYEKRIAELERSKLLLEEKSGNTRQPKGKFEELFELALRFLANPSNLWNSGEFTQQKLVLRLTFADHLAYCPINGFSNPKTALPFKMLDVICDGANRLAGTGGFEPRDGDFEIGCSRLFERSYRTLNR